MNEPGSVTLRIQSCLDGIQAGDQQAIDQLMDCAYERLVAVTERIVGSMVSPGKGVRASDVFQESYLRLRNALLKDNVNPRTVGEFLGLASRHIRFQVLDMLRQVKQRREAGEFPDDGEPQNESAAEMWICFYEAFEELSEEERTAADLLWTWVEGKGGPAVPHLTQYEAADVLGVSRDRVKDLWRNARLKIARRCQDFQPFAE
ncbi:MAG: sigma-70 family RNA polymerase sigma factor [Pirellulaceae bacterium]